METGSTVETPTGAESLFKKGANIALAKRGILPGKTSGVGVGVVLHGKLKDDIQIDRHIAFEAGGNTTSVKNITISETTERILVDTSSGSEYELLDKNVQGLGMDTELGSVHLPLDSQLAKLDDEVVDFSFPDQDRKRTIYINKPALKGVLMESNGAQIFRAIHGRFIILAKVGNIHLPFYISSRGTSGKNQGEWYPFFGYTGDWVIKGHVGANGKMSYHPEIDKVTDLLNKNLILPADLFLLNGKIEHKSMSGAESAPTMFNINNHLLYMPYLGSDVNSEKDFVGKITGYKPSANYGDTAQSWINSIVAKV